MTASTSVAVCITWTAISFIGDFVAGTYFVTKLDSRKCAQVPVDQCCVDGSHGQGYLVFGGDIRGRGRDNVMVKVDGAHNGSQGRGGGDKVLVFLYQGCWFAQPP